MFDELRFRLKVKKIRRQEKKQMAQIRLEHSKKYGSDTSKYTSEQLDELMGHEKISVSLTQEEIANAYTWHLLEQMDKLLLQQPDFYSRGQWISSLACGMHLHSDALAEIRDAIRKERKERSEVTRLWITIIGGGIGALTGVIGAMIGLLAYLDKLHH